MSLTWTWLLPLLLLAAFRGTQSCNPEVQDSSKTSTGEDSSEISTGENYTLDPALNVARGRPACQSSTYPHPKGPSASKAVDGNSDGNFFHSSCTHTNSENQPWWYVDLGEQHSISTVVVKNRLDCCGSRLLGAKVHVGDSVEDNGKSNPVCGKITDYNRGSVSIFHCQGMKGRYVSVNHPGEPAILTLCEVEVYGTKVEVEP